MVMSQACTGVSAEAEEQAARIISLCLGVPCDAHINPRQFPLSEFAAALAGGQSMVQQIEKSDALDFNDTFRELESLGVTGGDGTPQLSLIRWPQGLPFALFLSHDIDQIHDRELFRILADINHVRRRAGEGEPGNTPLALRRICRALFRPKPAERDFETLLDIEGRQGFRSSFYLLHDPYWRRNGPRYSFRSPAIRRIAHLIQKGGGELGVHGGYYRFNNAAAYRESREAVYEAFGVVPVGIRNHHLKFSYPETWRAQEAAGFAYDSTYGYPERLGSRAGLPFPFFPAVPTATSFSLTTDPKPRATNFKSQSADSGRQTPASINSELSTLNLLELPLTVMDTTLFRYLGLSGEAALEAAWATVESVVKIGGLVTLLWHNNYFNEPEYWDWQMVYEELLKRLAPLRPWCATGQEINNWWRARAAVVVAEQPRQQGRWLWRISAPQEIYDLCLLLRPASMVGEITVGYPGTSVLRSDDTVKIHLSHVPAGSAFDLQAKRL